MVSALTAGCVGKSDNGAGSDQTASPTAATSTTTAAPAVPTADVLAAVAAAAATKKLPSDLAPSVKDASKDTGYAFAQAHGCLPTFATTSVDVSKCTYGDPNGTKTMVLVGDSHSSMWLPAFNAIGQRAHWKVINFNKVSCGAASITPYLYQEKRTYTECVAWHEFVTKQINELRPALAVFTSKVDGSELGSGQSKEAPAIWQAGLIKTLDSIVSTGTRKVVLGDIPYVWSGSYGAGPNCLATHSGDVTACSSAKNDAALKKPFRDAEKAAAAATKTPYIDVTPWFCTDKCFSVINKIQVYADFQHITRTYAMYLSGSVQAALEPQLS
jgi:hypothetical protein